MNDNILIRTINENEWEEAMNLAWDTFILYEAPEYTKEGITSFRNFVRDPILKTLFIEGKYNVLAAFNNNIIVGIIGVRNETHISLLFVDSEYHKKGIARRLVEKTFERTYEKYGKREMTVNSSPYAVGFYHKMGFVDTDIEQTTDGIRYTPMKARF
ncbi:MAG: GNAT family N-acetyltransferase [Lachnospiraceae bacterium]|jgi:GNAT superfamily N-acetyltransferase|nr:GNAT family N-acetyltransferase [Lachnospiraceae bacterium]MCI6665599.1 GNAT family N-acetyltransferase [Lachnospiraceae bacterium]MCI6977980.1 GNAT family N-acetyltransferase [Lachnospiraceae bacterium]MDD6580495.1 GNAT family N-acetyltransferase [Lachnospiraceae bacterium]MDD7223581.1 GNAT family N-acetyltransferase [Lachnospiraceae bacterium]